MESRKLVKNLVCLAAVVSISVGACAQGTVNFNNSKSTVGGNGAKVTYSGSGVGVGSTFFAQLWAGPDVNNLAPVGATLAFRDGIGAGFLNTTGQDSVRVLPTVAPGAIATVQIRTWDGTKGTTFDECMAFGGVFGTSSIFTVKTGGDGDPPSLPANLVGLRAFEVGIPIPELSTVALGALALGALLWRRRG